VTFLNPLALFGLAAAAIPVLLHLFNLRKLKTIEFSTLSFLRVLEKTKIRRIKIRQIVLLILRTLLILLLVIAFSRPTLKGTLSGPLAAQTKTTVVILFDDSQSMTARNEHGELLQQAKNAAVALLDALTEGDEVYFVPLSHTPHADSIALPAAQKNIVAVRSAVHDLSPSFRLCALEDGLRYAARLLAVSNNFNKEVYIFSDFQSGSLESTAAPSPGVEHLFDPATGIFCAPLGGGIVQNISLDRIEIPNTILEVHRSFAVKATLTNHGTSAVHNYVVSVYQNGVRAAQKGVDLVPGQTVETEFNLVPSRAGFIFGKVEGEDDDLAFDNTRYFTVHLAEETRVLLVGADQDVSYLSLALATYLTDSSASIRTVQTSWNRLTSVQLDHAYVVVAANPHDLAFDRMALLKPFVQRGGGLVLFPGAQTVPQQFNAECANVLGIPLLAPREHAAASSTSFLEFDKVDMRHPLFAGMFDENQSSAPGATRASRILESPQIRSSFHFLPSLRSKVIVTLSDGTPFLLEERAGNGAVLLFSVPADAQWSDLPFKGIFVPLVHRSVAYLAQPLQREQSLLVGEEQNIRLRGPVPLRMIETKPGGIQNLLAVQQHAGDRYVQVAGTDVPGLYTTATADSVIAAVAVNMDPAESQTAPSSKERAAKMFARLGVNAKMIHRIENANDVQSVLTEFRLGAELWKSFLLAALFVAVIEMLVARDTK
jgi:hypothetical protein